MKYTDMIKGYGLLNIFPDGTCSMHEVSFSSFHNISSSVLLSTNLFIDASSKFYGLNYRSKKLQTYYFYFSIYLGVQIVTSKFWNK